MSLTRDEHLPRIRLFKHNHLGFDVWYGKLINDFRLLPLAGSSHDTKQGIMILHYKDHISVHVNYSE